MIVRSLMLMLAFTFVFATDAFAQDAIKPEKRALIQELYTLNKVDKLAEQMFNAMFADLESQMPLVLSKAVETVSGADEQAREGMKKAAGESSVRVLQKFKKLFLERVNLNEVMEQIFFPLYDKHFTEEELKELVAFYKTPIGQKSIRVQPELMQESMQRSSNLLQPKVLEIMREVLQEELKIIKHK